jgi:hypothetical protein
MFTLRPGVMSFRLLPFMRSLLSPKAGGGDVASDVTQAYRFPAGRVAMHFGVTVMSTRGSDCGRVR